MDPSNADACQRSNQRKLSDLQSLFVPSAAYREMLANRSECRKWLAWRRPVVIGFIIACSATLMATAQLSVGSALSAMVYWSYVPAIECLALLIACKGQALNVSRSQLIDIYFVSHTPWLLWLCIWAILANWFTPAAVHNLLDYWLIGGGSAVLIWSLWLDWCFFLRVCQQSRARASRSLFIQRLISWPIILWVFGYGSLWPGMLEKLHL